MKFLPALLLAAAGGAAAWIAYTAPEQSYESVTLDDFEAPEHVPIAVTADPGPGEELVVLEVEGMCCSGCSAKLYARLADAPEIRAAAVDFDRGVAEALVPSDLDVDELLDLLTFDKYSARPKP